ncbi:MAG: ATP synthase F1 subunit delta, partial [Rickettsiales bacterium]|nr:ATP synthase F1 subunit delta [Rickettsiales bacterium]
MSVSYLESKKIADRYVTAAFALALEKKKQDELGEDLAAIAAMIEQSADLKKVLANPLVQPEELNAVFKELLKDAKATDLTLDFIKTLTENKRAQTLPQVAETYREKLMEHKGELSATVTAAHPLKAAQTKKITDALSKAAGKPVHVSVDTDPSIIGGIVIRMGSRMLDRSVAGKLQRLKTGLSLSSGA